MIDVNSSVNELSDKEIITLHISAMKRVCKSNSKISIALKKLLLT